MTILAPRAWKITLEGVTDFPDSPELRAQLLSAVSLSLPIVQTLRSARVEIVLAAATGQKGGPA